MANIFRVSHIFADEVEEQHTRNKEDISHILPAMTSLSLTYDISTVFSRHNLAREPKNT